MSVTSEPIVAVEATVAVSAAPKQMKFEDYILAIFTQDNIKLRSLKTSPSQRFIEVEIEPLDNRDPQAAAERAMGMIVKAISLADPATRATLIRVAFDGPNKKLRALKMTEPTISDLLDGRITEDQAARQIKIEEEK